MVKVRMNTADVAAEVKCLRKLIGMRCSNVYDLSPKIYMFKLMKSSGVTESGESEKALVLLESGVRLHTTEFVRDKSTTPSGFTLKLRKHIRTRRLEDVRQLGMDRVVDFQFGVGSTAHHIILELYSQGNLILTDADYNVLTLLRTHRDDESGMTMMPHHSYPVNLCRSFERTGFDKLQTILSNALDSELDNLAEETLPKPEVAPTEKDMKKSKKLNQQKASKQGFTDKKDDEGNKGKKKSSLKLVLNETLGYGPAICEHMILDAGLLPNMKVSTDENVLQSLAAAITRFEDWLNEIRYGEFIPEGYIIMKKEASGKKETLVEEGKAGDQVYEEFSPLLLQQYKSRNVAKFEIFDKSMDEFFSKIESQRSEQQHKAQEESAMQKLRKIRTDQENRVESLKKEVDRSVHMAELIEYNLDDVDAAILAVRSALASGMDWKDLSRMVKEEKKTGNPVASLIHSLQLEKNCITLLLSNNLDDMDEDQKTQPADKVEVDLALSAHANACRWFEMKKKQASKQEKTVAAHTKAFKAAEKKTQKQISQAKTVAAISHIRKVHWFEKFNWFISSENYLVISGRDAQQNELLVKRYMKKGDLYVHAELHGASSTLIKNHIPDQPVPPLTLNQAGSYTVCQSQAWDSKIVTSAWWVYPHQVSKTAPTGEYLTVGSFMIRGKKNFLPPHPLVMGFGILFRLDESSLGSHLNERRVRGDIDDQDNNDDDKYNGPQSSYRDEVNIREKKADELLLNELSATDQAFEDHSSIDNKNGYLQIDNNNQDTLPLEATKSDDVLSGVLTSASLAENCPSVDHEDTNVNQQIESNNSENSTALEELMDKALGLGSIRMSDEKRNKYGLVGHQIAAEEEKDNIDDNTSKQSRRDKPYVSKAERRKQKKGTTDNTTDEKEETTSVKNEVKSKGNTKSADEKPENLVTATKVSRGKKGKIKKIKEKYSEQDEEERQLRMSLLASAGTTREIETKATEKKETSSSKSGIQGEADVAKICYKCKKVGHVAKECTEVDEEAPKSHEIGHHISAKLDNSAIENISGRDALTSNERMALQEDDIHELGEDDKEKWTELDSLTGNPLPTDILLYAVPVCGPYNALQSYKYRVKITPGTAKKGKAAKTSLNLFSQMPDATSREKELMKAITEPELVAAIIGNSKISAPGLTHFQQRQKKGKKSSNSEL